jgi:hypothetical protein
MTSDSGRLLIFFFGVAISKKLHRRCSTHKAQDNHPYISALYHRKHERTKGEQDGDDRKSSGAVQSHTF